MTSRMRNVSRSRAIVLATRNPGKLREMRRVLRPSLPGVRLLSLLDFPNAPGADETGHTYYQNARIKAVAAASATGLTALADDSGIEVDALHRAPGPRSSRFAGPHADDEDRNTEIRQRLADLPRSRRGASFVCAVAVAAPHGAVRCVTRKCRGAIAEAPRGNDGFGYDPIFIPTGGKRTFGQVTRAEKDAISHRGKALRAAVPLVRAALAASR
jgi:XTP/dITP diphosphohydrolase